MEPRENPDGDECDETLRRQSDFDQATRRVHVELRKPSKAVGSDRRPEDAKESSECDRHGGDRSGLNHDEESPSIQKTHERAHGFAKKNVLATSSGVHRRELAVRE